MIELLLGVGLVMGDPCDVIQDWRTDVKTCIVSSRDSATAGGFTVESPRFYPNDVGNLEDTGSGGASFDAGPEPEDGYYVYGLRSVCIAEDGSVTPSSGTGMAAEMYPGHYRSESRLVGGPGEATWVVAYNTDPCLAPAARGAVLFAAYSPVELAANPGWQGSNQLAAAGGLINFNMEYFPTTREVRLSYSAPTGTWQGYTDASSTNAKVNEFLGFTGGLPELRVQCWTGSTKTQDYGFSLGWSDWKLESSGNSGPYTTAASRSRTCPVGTTDARFEIIPRSGYPLWDSIKWTYGDAEADEQTGYVGQAYLVRDPDLDDIRYRPVNQGFVYPSWLCDDWECVTSFCDEIETLDVVGGLKCLFTLPHVDMDELRVSLGDLVEGWPLWRGVQYGNGLVLSIGYMFGQRDGDCGDLFAPNDALFGRTFNTCGAPLASPVHTVASALSYIAGGLFLISMISGFAQTGRVKAFFNMRMSESEANGWYGEI